MSRLHATLLALALLSGCHDATEHDDLSVDDASAVVHDLASTDVAAAPDGASAPDLGGGTSNITIVAEDGGAKGFALGDAPFVPIGVNYFNEVTSPEKTFDLFDTQTFDLPTIDQDLSAIAQHGFTFVRLWLKGIDTDNGFASTKSDAGSDPATFDKYVTNIVATIHAARQHGLRVVLTGDFGSNGEGLMPTNYIPTSGLLSTTSVDGLNRILLDPTMRNGLGDFYAELAAALVAKDPGIGSSIFYFDLYNELHYELFEPPLSESKPGKVFPYAGAMYDLSEFTADTTSPKYVLSRQALMDTAARDFVQVLSARLRDKIPGLFVTVSSFHNAACKHYAFDGGALDGVCSPNKYPLRPFFVLQGGADIIDMHTYPKPGSDLKVATDLQSNEVFQVGATSMIATAVSAATAPLIAGEFGAYLTDYGVDSTTTPTQYTADLNTAITELQADEQATFCDYYFTGFCVWDWNVGGTTFTLVSPDDPNNLLMHALAPTSTPTFCGHTVTP